MMHYCEYEFNRNLDAFCFCEEQENGTFVVGNGEYGNEVNFCPFCGKKAKIQLEELGFAIKKTEKD
ncbi:MAG: hypothetical protein ISS63_09535 [Desulfobacteraceae bacterium]|nr:hypothetical protein [Desulfobacteraceae bacterium]